MDGISLKKRLSANIKELRKNKFTQETLAEAAGISWQMMNGIEGCRKWPSENTLAKIATALNVDVYELFLPVQIKSSDIKKPYNAITKKVVAHVKEVLNNALADMLV